MKEQWSETVQTELKSSLETLVEMTEETQARGSTGDLYLAEAYMRWLAARIAARASRVDIRPYEVVSHLEPGSREFFTSYTRRAQRALQGAPSTPQETRSLIVEADLPGQVPFIKQLAQEVGLRLGLQTENEGEMRVDVKGTTLACKMFSDQLGYFVSLSGGLLRPATAQVV